MRADVRDLAARLLPASPMTDPDASARLLTALQFADSAFPSGAFAFSWGLEGLAIDAWIRDGRTLQAVVDDALRQRWHPFDRVVLARVLDDDVRHPSTAPSSPTAPASRDGSAPTPLPLDRIAAIDDEVDAMGGSSAARQGSRRAGRALLGVHARLGVEAAADYLHRLETAPRRGHLVVVQALVWRALSLTVAQAEAISAWQVASTLCSAATRLHLVGHIGAQQALTAARQTIAGLLAEPVESTAPLRGFSPLTDIAMMRHPAREHRLFMT